MNTLLVDSDVLIDVLRQLPLAIQVLAQAQVQNRLAISLITRLEIITGCRDKEGLQQAERLLKKFELLPLNKGISELADTLITRFYLSNGLKIGDGLIAATALYHDSPLLTKN